MGWAQFGVGGFLGFELVFAGFLVFWVGWFWCGFVFADLWLGWASAGFVGLG